MNGAERIAAERKRQIEVEGWTPEHDRQHSSGDLARAASCYAARWHSDRSTAIEQAIEAAARQNWEAEHGRD